MVRIGGVTILRKGKSDLISDGVTGLESGIKHAVHVLSVSSPSVESTCSYTHQFCFFVIVSSVLLALLMTIGTLL